LTHNPLQNLPLGSEMTLTVTGGSMRPLLRRGDQITLSILPADRIKVGDVVTVGTPSGFLTHRFLGYVPGSDELLLVGDRRAHLDPPFPCEDLVGVVISRQRNGRILDLTSGNGKLLNGRLAWLIRLRHSYPRLNHYRTYRRLFHGIGRLLHRWHMQKEEE
jgi:hypothetical protein